MGPPERRGQPPQRPMLGCCSGHSCYFSEPLVTLPLPSEKPGRATVTLGVQWCPSSHVFLGAAPLARCLPETSSQVTVSQHGCW